MAVAMEAAAWWWQLRWSQRHGVAVALVAVTWSWQWRKRRNLQHAGIDDGHGGGVKGNAKFSGGGIGRINDVATR